MARITVHGKGRRCRSLVEFRCGLGSDTKNQNFVEPSVSDESLTWVNRLRAGDSVAEQKLVDRYTDRLVHLARTRLSSQIGRRVDPEDVLQSVYRSFFRRLRGGQFEVRHSQDIWSLLATITINKSLRQVRHHSAQKRAVAAEVNGVLEEHLQTATPAALSREPLPEDVAVFVEETEMMMRRLSALHRQILHLCMQGHDVDHIAQRAECSERTVERAVHLARTHLEQRLLDNDT